MIYLLVLDENKTIIGLKLLFVVLLVSYGVLDENKTIIGLKFVWFRIRVQVDEDENKTIIGLKFYLYPHGNDKCPR